MEATRIGQCIFVTTISFILQATTVGHSFCSGIYLLHFQLFSEYRSTVWWIGSLNTGLLFGAGPVASLVVNQLGTRFTIITGGIVSSLGLALATLSTNVIHLYFTYGLLTGIGFSFIYIPSVVMVAEHCKRYVKITLPISSAGVGIGSLVFAPLLTKLINYYGWRSALFVSASIMLQCCVLGALVKPLKKSVKDEQEHSIFLFKTSVKEKIYNTLESIASLSLLTDAKFLILLLNNVLWNIGNLIFLVTLPDYNKAINLPDWKSAWVLSTVGICSTLGRFFMGCGAKCCKRHIWPYLIPNVISGILLLFYPFRLSYTMNIILCSGYGLLFGAQIGLLALITVEEFGLERLPAAYGYCMFADGIGALIGPPLSGLLYDITHQHVVSFVVGGAVTVFSGLLIILLPIIDRLKRSTTENLTTVETVVDARQT
ncbi:DgyrCDS6382 [Dimorphilus gyrociliatus]|uniref:DgyrCDS6382 n=1 Tax=Dimorphilus gyrociliatus TaxID=2664684 RepID=A0A7I8VMW2_9ANNE|nr:DgyrCDS6382 [Dimorphilus gyrociliatus]